MTNYQSLILLKYIVLTVAFAEAWKDPDPFDHTITHVDACQKDSDCQSDEYCNGYPGCLKEAKCNTTKLCICPPGRIGWRCQYSTCQDFDYCVNNADCIIVGNRHRCVCLPDTYGDRCENKICNVESNCDGVCIDEKTCSCQMIDPNKEKYCTPTCDNYCLNGGSCSKSQNGKLTCKCSHGFSGDRCSKEFCDPSKCVNGVCYHGDCLCHPGYYGSHCQNATCDNYNGCFDKGVCVVENYKLRCKCDERRYAGTYCEHECSKICPENSICGSDDLCYFSPEHHTGVSKSFDIQEVANVSILHIFLSIIIAACIVFAYRIFQTKYMDKRQGSVKFNGTPT